MPPLPPKPKSPAVVRRALVLTALATSACAHQPPPPRIGQELPPPPPRIGQPPPVRIGAEACSEAQVTDAQGQPLAGVKVTLATGQQLTTDAHGLIQFDRHGVEATIQHPGFEPLQVQLLCGGTTVALQPAAAPPPPRIGPPPPVRIGPPPPPPRIGARPPPRIGKAPQPVPPPRIGKPPPQDG